MKREFKQIGLMVEPLSGYGSKILDGISRYAQQKADWRIALFDRERKELVDLIKTWKGDGMICTLIDQNFQKAATGRKIPIVNVAGLVDNKGIPSVLSDDVAIGRMAAAHLMDRGFTNFAYVSRRAGHQYSDQRGAGFKAALKEAGHDCAMVSLSLNNSDEELLEKIRNLPRPLAVLSVLDRTGAMVLEACWKAGLKVPEEIAVLGIGNHQQHCELCSPTLSSVEVDFVRRGYEAAALLDKLMQGEKPPEKAVLIPPVHVVERKSTDVFAFDDTDVAKALGFIRDHADSTIKVRDVVAATGISRRSLEGRFNSLVGRTLHEEIWRAHFDLAMRLLSSSDLSLQEVAERSGFRTASALVNLFRLRYGITPKEYRVANRR